MQEVLHSYLTFSMRAQNVCTCLLASWLWGLATLLLLPTSTHHRYQLFVYIWRECFYEVVLFVVCVGGIIRILSYFRYWGHNLEKKPWICMLDSHSVLSNILSPSIVQAVRIIHAFMHSCMNGSILPLTLTCCVIYLARRRERRWLKFSSWVRSSTQGLKIQFFWTNPTALGLDQETPNAHWVVALTLQSLSISTWM